MDQPGDLDPEPAAPDSSDITTLIIMMEGVLGVIGVAGGIATGIDWWSYIGFSWPPILYGILAGVGLVLVHCLLLFPGKNRNPFYRWIYRPFEQTMVERLRTLSYEDIILIAMMSGLAEELLFRGWIQSELGLWTASILFGLLHIWSREGIPYGIYAIGIGFVLGLMFEYTGSIWMPVAAHAVNNFLGLLAIKQNWLPRNRPDQNQDSAPE